MLHTPRLRHKEDPPIWDRNHKLVVRLDKPRRLLLLRKRILQFQVKGKWRRQRHQPAQLHFLVRLASNLANKQQRNTRGSSQLLSARAQALQRSLQQRCISRRACRQTQEGRTLAQWHHAHKQAGC
ncbi:hypothetical protein AB1Y20_022188 [Prymnesium parvum]|uniref:Uncharacterized protein n=1 Tax=Prymnesium parvum TaxID=97485 RepID=A0AB34JIW3_PRYPA